MDLEKLKQTAKLLMANDKGLLAMDESTQSCNKRFAKLGIPETEEMRRAWRELIITTPGLGNFISGVILYDETIHQQKKDGTSFIKVLDAAGIIPGIKVDAGLKDMVGYPGEKVTEGLDGLPERLSEYYKMGARFAKWRAAFTIGQGIPTPLSGVTGPLSGPSQDCIRANAKSLADYALMCQEAGLVPMVEPEVLMDGGHTIDQCRQVTEKVLEEVFKQLDLKGVALEGMILKPNMVLPGLDCPVQESVEQVADATVACLLSMVPAKVAGVAFLSGGQSSQLASARLSDMNARFKSNLPWPLTFSYSRAIQYPALEIWAGKPDKSQRHFDGPATMRALGGEENIEAAQKALYHRAKLNHLARKGEYNMDMEKA